MKTFDHLTVVGLREWVALPDLGCGLRAKIGYQTSTSSLHATEIEPFERDGEQWVRFNAHLGSVGTIASPALRSAAGGDENH